LFVKTCSTHGRSRDTVCKTRVDAVDDLSASGAPVGAASVGIARRETTDMTTAEELQKTTFAGRNANVWFMCGWALIMFIVDGIVLAIDAPPGESKWGYGPTVFLMCLVRGIDGCRRVGCDRGVVFVEFVVWRARAWSCADCGWRAAPEPRVRVGSAP